MLQSFLDVECLNPKLDIAYVVDGSGSIRAPNFESIKLELKALNGNFDIGPDKTQIALMQFGRATDTKIEFNLGEKNTLQATNDGVDNMKWLVSVKTDTGDALKKAREQARCISYLFIFSSQHCHCLPHCYLSKYENGQKCCLRSV